MEQGTHMMIHKSCMIQTFNAEVSSIINISERELPLHNTHTSIPSQVGGQISMFYDFKLNISFFLINSNITVSLEYLYHAIIWRAKLVLVGRKPIHTYTFII